MTSIVRARAAAVVLLALFAPSLSAQDSSLTMGEAVRIALRNNPQVIANRHVAAQAAARVDQARAAFLPSLNLVAGNRQRTFNSAELGIALPGVAGRAPLFDPDGEVLGPINIYDARIRLSQQLYAPAARAHLQSTVASAHAISAESDAEHARIALQAAMTFVRLQRAHAHVSARLEDSTLASDLLGIAREQQRAGVGIMLDVTRAESQLASAHSQLIFARAERARASLDLARLLGLDLHTAIRPQGESAAASINPDTSNRATLLATALQQARVHRPELKAVELRLAAVSRLERGIRAERFPTLSAFADNGLIGRAVDEPRYTYSWGLQLSFPVLEFRRSAREREQSAVVRELEEQRRDLERTIAVEVESALIDFDAAHSQVESAQVRVQLGQRELQQARDRFVAGVAGNLDVVAASQSLNIARTALADAMAAQEAARVSLAHAQGTLTEVR